jgi:hypothetical protein
MAPPPISIREPRAGSLCRHPGFSKSKFNRSHEEANKATIQNGKETLTNTFSDEYIIILTL